MAVTSEQVAAFLPSIHAQARRYSGWYGSEYDDLVQEGMVAVWLSLNNKTEPTDHYIGYRMKNWVKLVRGNWSFERIWEDGLNELYK